MATPSVSPESAVSHQNNEWTPQSAEPYACPVCKQALESARDGFLCRLCARTYPILNGIPDFVVINLDQSKNRSLRAVGKKDGHALLNSMASIYETWIYPAVCNLYAGWRSTSLQQLAHDIADIITPQQGLILDAACGPGTYGRRIASASRTVIGTDICMSMMREGLRSVEREKIPNVHFARATVEALPFRDGLFDAAICAGALNHFSDTVLALREINRTMKVGAPLAVMCFARIPSGLMKYEFIRNGAEKGGGHVDTVATLERYVAQAGFEDFRPHTYGSIVVFSARKRPPAQ